jgi:hypothetical protein
MWRTNSATHTQNKHSTWTTVFLRQAPETLGSSRDTEAIYKEAGAAALQRRDFKALQLSPMVTRIPVFKRNI